MSDMAQTYEISAYYPPNKGRRQEEFRILFPLEVI